MRNNISSNAFVYISAAVCFFILTAIVFLLPLEFSGYRTTDSLAPIWYLVTQTGGFYGAMFILMILFVYLIIHFRRASRKFLDLYIFMGMVLFTQIFVTGLSLYLVKDFFHNPRPSHLYFVEKGFVGTQSQEFLDMPPDKKRIYLTEKTKFDSGKLSDIYPPILSTWVNDSGFSFPSGHSQTSFFLGTIISFVIYRTGKRKNKFNCLIPLGWAIIVCMSRVIIGVHYPLDVAAGAFTGMAAAFIIISLNKVSRIF